MKTSLKIGIFFAIVFTAVLILGCSSAKNEVREASRFYPFNTNTFTFITLNENMRKYMLMQRSEQAALAGEIDWISNSEGLTVVKSKKQMSSVIEKAVVGQSVYDKLNLTEEYMGVTIHGREAQKYSYGAYDPCGYFCEKDPGNCKPSSTYPTKYYVDKCSDVGCSKTCAEWYDVGAATCGGSESDSKCVGSSGWYSQRQGRIPTQTTSDETKEMDESATSYAVVDDKYFLSGNVQAIKRGIELYKTGSGTLETKISKYVSTIPIGDMFIMHTALTGFQTTETTATVLMSVELKTEYVAKVNIAIEKSGDYLEPVNSIEGDLLREGIKYKRSEKGDFIIISIAEIGMNKASGFMRF